MTNTAAAQNNTVVAPYPPSRSHLAARRKLLLKSLFIEPGTLADYQQLSRCHYRDGRLGPIAAIWIVRQRIRSPYILDEPLAVIVYTYPAPNLAARNIATMKFFGRKNKSEGLTLLNGSVRCISRIIVNPQWRGNGIASWLVRATMPVMDVAMIESMAAMGRFHPFLEKAGMRPYCPPQDPAAQNLIATLQSLRIGRNCWHDPDKVQLKMDCLMEQESRLLERHIKAFLGRFGKRRKMLGGIERTTFVLEHLSQQWTYFAWLNPKRPVAGLRLSRGCGPARPAAIYAVPNRQTHGPARAELTPVDSSQTETAHVA